MFQAQETLVRFFAALLGLSTLAPADGGVDGVFAVVALFAVIATAAVATASVRRLVGALVALLMGSVSVRPVQAPELAVSAGQSIPDAPGKPRPRAPARSPAVA